MGVREWFKDLMVEEEEEGPPPSGGQSSVMDGLLGRGRKRSMGEYDADTYPQEMKDQLARREDVTRALLMLNVTDRESRSAAIPQLRELLRKYPHPLVYQTLIHAYVDAGRFDEAKGVAFAAKQRRQECARSEYPEIRSEIDALSEWTQEEIEEFRQKAGGG